MTATTFTPAPASATAPQPPLTRASADRLFWRQEWARHWPVWLNGLALWIWLFLVPGSTTEESQVLRWSILWTGALALVLAGDDLRRGIDPLVRGLALDPRRRWQMRTAAVLAGGMLFYLAGCAATADAWAWRLWSQVASGDFIGHADTAPSPFAPWQGLGVIALVAVLCCLAAANFHGMILGSVYTAAVWLASYCLAGTEPAVLYTLDSHSGPFGSMPDPYERALLLGRVSILLAPVLWFVGRRHAARRAPLTTSGNSIRFLSLGIALGGALAVGQLSLWTLDSQSDHQTVLLAMRWLDVGLAHPNVPPSTRGWMWAAWIEAVLLVGWSWSLLRAARPRGAHAPGGLLCRWLPWLAAPIALAHLVAQPAEVLLKPSLEFEQVWPHPLASPVVTTSQSWREAYDNPTYSPLPTGYDVCLCVYYPGYRQKPIVVQTGALAMPSAEFPSRLAFTLPPNTLWNKPQEFRIALARTKGGSRHLAPNGLETDLQFMIEAPALARSLWRRSGWITLTANFAESHFMPQSVDVRDRGTGWLIAAWSITLVPQRPDQPATERPWFEFVPAHEDAPSLPPSRPHEPGVAWFKYVLGFFGGCPISLLLVPLVLLGGILLVHTRFGGLALVALATSLLLVYIWADARRIEKELVISGDLARPTYQRDLARARASSSFFHKLDPRADL